MRLHGLVLS